MHCGSNKFRLSSSYPWMLGRWLAYQVISCHYCRRMLKTNTSYFPLIRSVTDKTQNIVFHMPTTDICHIGATDSLSVSAYMPTCVPTYGLHKVCFIRDTMKLHICLSLQFYLMFAPNFPYGRYKLSFIKLSECTTGISLARY